MFSVVATFSFVVLGTPIGWQRAGRAGKSSFTPKKTAEWEAEIWAAARRAGAKPMADGAVRLVVEAVWKRPAKPPKGCSKEHFGTPFRLPKLSAPDWDNVAKAVGDAIQDRSLPIGVEQRLIRNDARIFDGRCSTWWGAPGEQAHMLVTVEVLA